MTTIEPERAQFSARESHQARQVAESFGSDAVRYDRTRPRYPQALVDRILAASPGPDALDVGIGTGVSAQPFQLAGCRVLGVDPDPRMAEFARRRGFVVEVAKFEDWDPAGRTFDLVVAGQTWHWVDPVAGAAKAAEVLRPGGQLALFWNVFQLPPDLGDIFAAVYQRVLPDSPFFRGMSAGLAAYSGQFTKVTDAIRETSALGQPEQWQVGWHRSYGTAEWLDVVPTFGGHGQLPPGKLEELLAGLQEAVDAAGGSFTMNYSAVAVTAVRTTAS
jgi:SAM-dependent methyltransferase